MGEFTYLLPMSFFHAWVAEDSGEGCEFLVVFDLGGWPLQHFEGSFDCIFLAFLVSRGGVHAVESVGQLDGLGIHLFDLFFNEFRIQFKNRCLWPHSVVVFKIPDHSPEISVRFNLHLCSFKFRELNFLSHFQGDDIMVDEFLGLFEVGYSGKKFINFSIGLLHFKGKCEFFQFRDIGE